MSKNSTMKKQRINKINKISPMTYKIGWEKSQQSYLFQELIEKTEILKNVIKLSVITILLIFSAFIVHGQNITQTVRGKVIDQESKMPLIGASVILVNSAPLKGTSTDLNGEFIITQVPVGRHSFKISSIGYEDNILSEIEVISGKELVLNIFMLESLTQLLEIIIKEEQTKGEPVNEMATISSRSFTVEETQRYAGSINDPARMVQSFAGVATSDDSSNEIIVRGNSPRGVLWRVQGVEIPNPNHFGEEGSSGGGISMLSANMLSTSDFFTGAFPAEYGNGYSAVFDLFLRKGNNQKREYTAQAGLLGVDFAFEGPYSKNYKGSYLINYRYSTLALIAQLGVDEFGEAIPVFQDLSYNINLPTEKLGTFSLWGIGGLSSQKFEDENENFRYRYNMGVAGLTHRIFLTKNTYLESVFSTTTSVNGYEEQEKEDQFNFKNSFENSTIRGSVMLNHKFNAHHTFRAGGIVNYKTFNVFQKYSSIDTVALEADSDGSTYLYQGYAQWKSRVNEDLTLNTGMHILYLGLNGQYSIEPRMGLQYQLTLKSKLNFGYGLHSRMESLAIFFSRDEYGNTPNEGLDFMKAHHFVFGFETYLKSDLLLKTEGYYQMLTDVPIAAEDEDNEFWLAQSMLNYNGGLVNTALVNEGKGKNYGVELTLDKFFTNNYYLTLTGSLYNSVYTPRNGKEYNTRYNGNYTANLSFGKEYYLGNSDNNVLGLNMRILTAGGKRWTPVLLDRSIEEGHTVVDIERFYEEREGAYFRGDLRISYRKNKKKYSSIWSLDIQNFSNHSNVWGKYYDAEAGEVKTSYQMGLIPVLNYKIEF